MSLPTKAYNLRWFKGKFKIKGQKENQVKFKGSKEKNLVGFKNFIHHLRGMIAPSLRSPIRENFFNEIH